MRSSFSELTEQEKNWLDSYIEGTIDPVEFEAMQDRMLGDKSLREVVRRYLGVHGRLSELGDQNALSKSWKPVVEPAQKKVFRFPAITPLAAAAGLAFFLGIGLMMLLDKSSAPIAQQSPVEESESAPSAKGFAVIESLFDPSWPEGSLPRQPGDSLGSESFRLLAGTARIQFFSGAFMTIEGPAEISLKSAWEAYCLEGAVRMKVPPAARGFKLHSPATEIIDLGTEFGLVVKDGNGQVEVFDGEISVKHQDEERKLVVKGEALDLIGGRSSAKIKKGSVIVPDTKKFKPEAAEQFEAGFRAWQSHRDSMAGDDRLIAFYTFEREIEESLIPNLALPRNKDLDGAVVLAEPVSGRWPGLKSAFEFRRPGSRIRVNLPGEFSALTLSCWVRIDSLDRRYNALFMADGYENGEPHWQIRDDGKLMLSVMVDEDLQHPKYPQSRFHHVYLSPKIWDLSMSGQWLHLTSVYDPGNRKVSHFVNGERVSQEEIASEFHVKSLRIGNGEIGNWGQPFREDPNFTIRNLNGRMDELALFERALSEAEVSELFEKSRSTR